MMPSWVGTIMVAMTVSIRALRPRKRSFAKANPARVEKKTTESVTLPATMNEFTSALENSTRWNALPMFENRLAPGDKGGGNWERAVLVREATTAPQYRGNAEKKMNAMSVR